MVGLVIGMSITIDTTVVGFDDLMNILVTKIGNVTLPEEYKNDKPENHSNKISYSEASNDEFNFSINNDQRLELFLIESDGIPKHYKIIKSVQTNQQHSYFNHVWLLYNKTVNFYIKFKLGTTKNFKKLYKNYRN